MRRRAAALAGLALLVAAGAARAQDPAQVGLAAGAPAGWAVALDADGLGATIARDAGDLQAAVPRGPRIRFRVGSAAGPEPAVLGVVGEPVAARIGPFEAVAITVDAEGYRRRIVTAVALGGLAFRLDLEGPVGGWERDLAAMEGALSAAELSAPPAADAARLQSRLTSAGVGSASAEAALAWLDRVLADAGAGRLILLPAPGPFRFWPVDPAELRILLELLGEPGAGGAPVDDGSGLRAALALRDRLAGAAPPPAGGAPPVADAASGADPVLGVEAAPVAGGPTPRGGATFEAGGPIRVRFDRLPGTADWITIVPAGTPDDRFGEWYWSDGSATPERPAGAPRRSGTLTFAGLPPGDYEVRLYFDWPNGGYRVRGRRPIRVVAAPGGPPPGIAAAVPPGTPVPAAGGGATYGPFTGEWASESQGYYATIRLTQIGGRVTGELLVPNGRGTIEGSVVEFVLTFTWLMENGGSGGGRFVLASDGSGFSGSWTDSTGRSAPWNGVRTGGAPPPAGAPPSAGLPLPGGAPVVAGAPPACDVSGTWDGAIQGHGNDAWTFTPRGDGAWDARESGLGNATGIATVSGRRMWIEWTTGGWSGTITVDLDGACGTATGANEIRTGAPGTHATTLRRRGDAAPPASNPTVGPALAWESDGGWRADWIPRGDGRTYDVLYTGPAGQQVRAVEELTVDGDRVWIRRLSSSDGVLCQGQGTVQPGGLEVRGTGECPGVNAGWSWRLTSGGAASAASAPGAALRVEVEAVGWVSEWTRRDGTDLYDAVHRGPGGQRVDTVERITVQGDRIWIRRESSSDNVLCQMEGTIQPGGGEARGTGACPGVNQGWAWRMTW